MKTGRFASIMLFVITILVIPVEPIVVAVDPGGGPTVTVSTDKTSYTDDATILVLGYVSPVIGDTVTLTLKDPAGSLIAAANASIDEDNGGYAASFRTGGQGWTSSGSYTLTVKWQFGLSQVLVTNSTTFIYTLSGGPRSSISTSIRGTTSAGTNSVISSEQRNPPTTSPVSSFTVPGVLATVAIALLAAFLLRRRSRGR